MIHKFSDSKHYVIQSTGLQSW